MTTDVKVAIVTGGSRGIGRTIALQLAQAGYQVAFNYLNNQAAADELVAEIAATGQTALAIQADVADAAAIQHMIQQVIEQWGHVDVLVNNAGITRDGLLATMELEDLHSVLQTNLLGAIYATQAVTLPMMRRKKGCIINISSSAASKPGRGQSNYAAAKGGLEAFTKAMAVELAPKKIRVNAIAPGVIETEMSARIRQLGNDEILSRLLIKRAGQSEEIAHAVQFLCSEHSAYMTGQVLQIDGGLKMA